MCWIKQRVRMRLFPPSPFTSSSLDFSCPSFLSHLCDSTAGSQTETGSRRACSSSFATPLIVVLDTSWSLPPCCANDVGDGEAGTVFLGVNAGILKLSGRKKSNTVWLWLISHISHRRCFAAKLKHHHDGVAVTGKRWQQKMCCRSTDLLSPEQWYRRPALQKKPKKLVNCLINVWLIGGKLVLLFTPGMLTRVVDNSCRKWKCKDRRQTHGLTDRWWRCRRPHVAAC